MMHEWMRDFCHAHGFLINAKKSKYIVSDCKGPGDPRWLPSVNGIEKIFPLPSTEHFRYLGLWISMDLNWSKQIQVMNKQIMDWRWKAFAAKVDPAQLKTSVIEYLLPRLEIGLLHADISQKICDAWMSTIIHTLCHRSGMNTIGTMNKKGFCFLADIPDLWWRTQTTRATEMLVNLNTKYCLCGRTTRARLCKLFQVHVSKINDVVQNLSKQAIKKRECNRLVPTIQYLISLNIKVVCKIKEDKKPLDLVADIQAALGKEQPQSIIAYTDGSTTPLAKNSNSGMGIVITDQLHRPLWSGGGVVRADGNNFIPEVAAAAIVIKACPKGLPLTLRMDSKAAIGAISKGLVSERRRVRAPGRLWLNFCRKDFLEKKHHIRLDHVSSHKGTLTKEQQGNDMADVIANEYRRQGERMSPCLYFMEDEEHFYSNTKTSSSKAICGYISNR